MSIEGVKAQIILPLKQGEILFFYDQMKKANLLAQGAVTTGDIDMRRGINGKFDGAAVAGPFVYHQLSRLKRPPGFESGGQGAIIQIIQFPAHRNAVGKAGDRYVTAF